MSDKADISEKDDMFASKDDILDGKGSDNEAILLFLKQK